MKLDEFWGLTFKPLEGVYSVDPNLLWSRLESLLTRPDRLESLSHKSQKLDVLILNCILQIKARYIMSRKTYWLVGLLFFVSLATACTGIAASPTATPQPTAMSMDSMSGMGSDRSTNDFAPLVKGIYEDGEVLFIHTEASDPDVAQMLTEMMAGPLVVLVPQLAQTPASLLAKVYVFTNGIKGGGPFGFQPDIFDAVPGDEATVRCGP